MKFSRTVIKHTEWVSLRPFGMCLFTLLSNIQKCQSNSQLGKHDVSFHLKLNCTWLFPHNFLQTLFAYFWHLTLLTNMEFVLRKSMQYFVDGSKVLKHSNFSSFCHKLPTILDFSWRLYFLINSWSDFCQPAQQPRIEAARLKIISLGALSSKL